MCVYVYLKQVKSAINIYKWRRKVIFVDKPHKKFRNYKKNLCFQFFDNLENNNTRQLTSCKWDITYRYILNYSASPDKPMVIEVSKMEKR